MNPLKPKLFRSTIILMYIIAGFWVLFAAAWLFRDSDYRYFYAVNGLGAAILIALFAHFLNKGRRWAWYATLIFAILNITLTITDQMGWFDLAYLVPAIPLLVMTMLIKKQPTTTDPQDELLYSVDENDNVLGKVTRREAHSNPNIIQRTVTVFIRDQRNNILITKRSATKDTYANHWGIGLGGHVGYGKKYLETAVQELKEEANISVDPNDLKDLGKILVRLPGESEFWQTYQYHLKNDALSPNSEEIDQIKFVSLKELGEMLINAKVKWKGQVKLLYNILLKNDVSKASHS
ncbi:MAG: NUDIX hydrolase, type 34 [Parcubacteria group bacterium GW2011_GWA2_48_9]|nr:MAG: NUDIX hydrolase, type 34 [Parcubacteria group bacterium GW2011_GWA2_48_9]